jgi:hypothetical protein
MFTVIQHQNSRYGILYTTCTISSHQSIKTLRYSIAIGGLPIEFQEGHLHLHRHHMFTTRAPRMTGIVYLINTVLSKTRAPRVWHPPLHVDQVLITAKVPV